MKWFSNLSIRNKLIIIILSVNLIVVGLIGASRIAWDIEQGRKALTQELSTLMNLIGDRSSAALIFDDTQLAKENLTSLQTIPHILEACIYRADNTLLAHYQRDADFVSSCLATATTQLQHLHHWFDIDRLNISSTIKQGDKHVGLIYLASDFSLIEMQLHDQLIFYLLALIAAVLISVLLANWAQRLISEPITEITRTAHAIEEQDDHSLRVTPSGNDEITQLAKTLNSMLDALELKNEQLRSSQKMDALGKLTGGIAHDYNNMLGVILGYADLLNNALNNEPKPAKYINEIIHAAERGARLTQKLLAFSKKKTLHASVVNINKLLHEERHMLEKTLTARIQLNYNLDEDLFPVYLDNDDLEDAILNMCINAMHAMKNKGQLTIETHNEFIDKPDSHNFRLSAGEYTVLCIADTGCGMNHETLANIFDPFYSTKGDKGTGLGLSQVYGFVTSSGGTIKVYSEPNKGTRFSLYFPRHHASSNDEEQLPTRENIQNGNGESILVVDDEASLCALTAEILTNHGYKTLQAENAQQALEILKSNPVNILFTDIIMPEMDGYELAAIVQKEYPSVKIQLASGFTDSHHVDMLDKDLHNKLIQKPYTSQTLLLAINTLLNE